MTKDEKILHDLTTHLRHKIMRDVSDHVELCKTAELNYHDVMSELMIFFTGLTASFAASQFEMDSEDFARVMVLQFQHAKEQEQ